MESLADGLVDGVDIEVQHGTDTSGDGRAEVSDVVNLPLVKAHALDEVDLDLVAGSDTADEFLAGEALVLCDGKDRRDVVARVGVLGGEEGVVVVELADGGAVGECGPLGGVLTINTEDGGPVAARIRRMRMRLSHDAGGGDRAADDGRHSNGGVVDDAVDDHVLGVGRNLDLVRGNLGDLVGEVLLNREILGGLVGAYFVINHRNLNSFLSVEAWSASQGKRATHCGTALLR